VVLCRGSSHLDVGDALGQAAAAARRERVLFPSFEESAEAIVANMLSPGIDLQPALQAGTLRFLTAMPEAMGAEEYLFRVPRAMEAFPPQLIVVDALSSSLRMGSELWLGVRRGSAVCLEDPDHKLAIPCFHP
jgi:hypothetical protein